MVLGGNRTEWGKAWIPESGGSGPQSGLPPTRGMISGKLLTALFLSFPGCKLEMMPVPAWEGCGEDEVS